MSDDTFMMTLLSAGFLVIAMLAAQRMHYDFLNDQKKQSEIKFTDAKLKEFEEYKKKVDSLILRAGFKQ